MTVAAGSYRTTRWKKQAAKGTYSAVGGQILRRVGGALTLERTKIENPQIRSDKQKAMSRHGLGMVTMPYSDIVTPGTHSSFLASLLLGTYATAATTGALINVTAAVTSSPAGTFTRAAGSFITDGFRLYQVVRWTGWTTTATANNAHNFLIIALSATVMTVTPLDDVAIVAKASGDSVTCTLVGKQVVTPASGHVDDYYTLEDWQPDIGKSEQAFDCRVESANIKYSPNANPTIEMAFKGLNLTLADAAYFSSPTAEASTDVAAVASGKLIVDGAVVATVTALDSNTMLALDMPPVIGASTYPFIASTNVADSGTITVLWEDQALMTKYMNETDLSLVIVVQNGRGAAADFVAKTIPRLRLFSATKSDGLESTTKAYQYEAAENTAGVAGTITSTVAFQDSLAT